MADDKLYKLSSTDGWYRFPKTDVYHYFFKGKSGCGIEMANDAHHDNDPNKYCGECSRNISILLEGQ